MKAYNNVHHDHTAYWLFDRRTNRQIVKKPQSGGLDERFEHLKYALGRVKRD